MSDILADPNIRNALIGGGASALAGGTAGYLMGGDNPIRNALIGALTAGTAGAAGGYGFNAGKELAGKGLDKAKGWLGGGSSPKENKGWTGHGLTLGLGGAAATGIGTALAYKNPAIRQQLIARIKSMFGGKAQPGGVVGTDVAPKTAKEREREREKCSSDLESDNRRTLTGVLGNTAFGGAAGGVGGVFLGNAEAEFGRRDVKTPDGRWIEKWKNGKPPAQMKLRGIQGAKFGGGLLGLLALAKLFDDRVLNSR